MTRMVLTHLKWLGLVLLGGAAFHLAIGYFATRPPSPLTKIANHTGKISSNTNHIRSGNATADKRLKTRFHVETDIISQQPTPAMNKMVAAASRLEANFVHPKYRFTNARYLHTSKTVRAHDFSRFLINPADTCSGSADSSQGSPFLMVLVLSSYLNKAIKEREAIRTTYGSVAQGKRWPGGKPLAASVRVVFVLGRPPSPQHRQVLEAESAQHGDVLVADFVDSYQNLTLKVLHGLHWVVQHCPQTKFVMKADDDVFVNLPLLTMFLVNRGSNNSIYGHAYRPSGVRRLGRWAVSRAVYPFPFYPAYMSGASYVLSTDAATKIVQASLWVRLVPIEDAFITGIMAQITAVRRISCEGFTWFGEGQPHNCEFINDKRIVGNEMRADEKTRLWLTWNDDHLVENCTVKNVTR